ncbi:acyl-CoA synthetase [Pseudoduganella ginsengisoli]|uniref:AMP-binding protein n=1 Tax=Pseudoduganella ginsengisoli TaxID=1462440 RepID=A0A6L6PX00_9BURK|nr:AMP-binding protein [Pseudoduganella ginsengisoli]MTW01674.1 AMP-binding protein [Pseudoduganella ginsengisoli]
MDFAAANTTPSQRITQLLAQYGAPRVCAAHLLCDRHHPESIAYRVVASDLSVDAFTYGDLKLQSERFAAALAAQGVRPGDRVATLMGKSKEFLITLMGIWRLGAVHVPLFTAFAPAAVALRLTGSQAKVVVCDAGQRGKLDPGPDMPAGAPWAIITVGGAAGARGTGFQQALDEQAPGFEAATLGPDSPLIQIYTSGTTGRPKGVVVPVRALASFHAYAELSLGLRPDDTYWCAADPGWAYGLYFGVLGSFTTGVSSVLLKAGFDAALTYKVLEQCGVTNFAAAPTVYRSMLASDAKPGALRIRCASSAGEPLTPEVNQWAIGALGVPVYDHYGQTETGMSICNHHDPRLAGAVKPGCMGTPMPGWSAAVLAKDADVPAAVGEVGRVVFDLQASPLAWFSGYESEPEKSAEKFTADGRWYVTGDLGQVDADGYFQFSSREDDVIIMAGYRIGPFEIESVLTVHPAVAECAVIAVPDAVRGEVIEAYVVPRQGNGASDALEKDLQRWVKERYAAHAYPRKVHFAQQLPKTPSGKVQRFVLREQRRQALEREAAQAAA